jgi:hypothetical protein
VLTIDDRSVIPIDDDDYDVFFDDHEIRAGSILRHPAFGLNDRVHLISRAKQPPKAGAHFPLTQAALQTCPHLPQLFGSVEVFPLPPLPAEPLKPPEPAVPPLPAEPPVPIAPRSLPCTCTQLRLQVASS